VSVFGSGQDADMSQDLLEFNQIDPGFQHMGSVTVPQGVA